MKVTNKNNITFGAIPCGKAKIKVFNETKNKFVNCPVTLVKLDSKNPEDYAAVGFAEQTWQKATYIKRIATASHFISFVDVEVYALTKQQKNFERLLFNRILGFAEMRPNKGQHEQGFLNRLQVRPDAINVNQENKKTHKHVGKAVIKSLKKIYKNISLTSENNQNIEAFYKKNGFIEDYYKRGTFYWSSDPFARLKMIIRNAMAKRYLLIKADEEW